MAMQTERFTQVLSSLSDALATYGFQPQADEDGKTMTVTDNAADAVYAGEKGALRLHYADERLELYAADDVESLETGAKRVLGSLLPENADERDVKYVVNEMSETLEMRFSQKAAVKKKTVQKAPQTVSKAAVKAGSFYDPNTLASKLCLVFPELRDAYKANLAQYEEFLPEEFFVNYGTPRVIEAIKENKPATMKKLFQTLNEIYEDGTNDTQSLIAVTILGALNNDQILLARCVDYMSETMAPPVIEVNKFLVTSKGKKAQAKMENPPPYKPKKKKKQGFLSQLMAGGGGMAPPAI
ncbi:MAG: hypothetical protein IKR49_04575 [Clostridia bacterium]|nr:hypothetical protein [Clostridia bacterium]